MRRHVFRDDRAGANERILPYGDAGQDRRIRAYRSARLHDRWDEGPILGALHGAVGIRGPRALIVCEHYAVTDENIVFYRHPLADKTMRRDLTILADNHPLLYLYERSDPRIITYFTLIQVDEIKNADILSNKHISYLFLG